eukprot:TRINITY_DN3096_c0_g1_i5.p1 TRINITY_DN3096_c0_g1~~TRINITY_DN3096_c0_g1_i5.p1  ORF type:complete len:302 (+),score=56.66 TRINITY_DN3096_c0_g1_i5:119-907(+)
MKEEHNSALSDAIKKLGEIKRCRKLIKDGLETADEKALDEAIKEAQKIGYKKPEVQKCQEQLAIVQQLDKAFKAKSEPEIRAALKMAMKSRLPVNELTADATKLADQLQQTTQLAIQTLYNVTEAIDKDKGNGATQVHFVALQRVLEMASELGGMTDVKEIQSVTNLYAHLRAESDLVEEVKAASEKGGWFNTDIKHGDYEHYKEPPDCTALKTALSKCPKAPEAKTEAGRIYFQLGTHLLDLREALTPCLKTLGESQNPEI